MQGVIRNSEKRLSDQKKSSEYARKRALRNQLMMSIGGLVLIGTFIFFQVLMLENFAEEEAPEQEETHAFGAGPLMQESLRRAHKERESFASRAKKAVVHGGSSAMRAAKIMKKGVMDLARRKANETRTHFMHRSTTITAEPPAVDVSTNSTTTEPEQLAPPPGEQDEALQNTIVTGSQPLAPEVSGNASNTQPTDEAAAKDASTGQASASPSPAPAI